MSLLFLVSVYDSASETYSKPVCDVSRGSALRGFQDIVNAPDNAISNHPEHFSCFILGTFDPSSARLDPYPSPVLVANAWELVK